MKANLKALEELLELAKSAAQKAYAPYSNYRVGAAVLTQDYSKYIGANIENASSNLGICAERIAISQAQINNPSEIIAIAVFCLDAKNKKETMPCGGCRQWMVELAPNAVLVTNGHNTPINVSDLLPQAFSLPRTPT